MSKKIKCPCCETGYLSGIELDDNQEVDFNKPLREHTHIGVCDICHRKIKYSVKVVAEPQKDKE